MKKIIDLRSDTVTIPDENMLEFMLKANVGDMVLGEDPSVNELEKYTAGLFGMEDAAFCPSGTMTNQIAINVHTRPGDEIICSSFAHVYLYEGGGIAFNSGASVALVESVDGTFTAADVERRVNPDDHHKPHTALVVIENTCNRGGGKIWNFDEIKRIRKVCDKHSLKLHLDGARLFNALTETEQNPMDYGKLFDSVSICLSKGLGAPVGSLLIGSREFIHQARRKRKVLGGTMRQAGYIASAGLYALMNNIKRLSSDHLNAKSIAAALSQNKSVDEVMPVETNIIIFKLKNAETSHSFSAKLKDKGILAGSIEGNTMRMVTHLNVTQEMTEQLVLTLPYI